MPQQVNIPGVGLVNFPDTMQQADIDVAAKRLYDEANTKAKPAAAPAVPFLQRAEDYTGRVLDAIPGDVVNTLKGIISLPFAGSRAAAEAVAYPLDAMMGNPHDTTTIQALAKVPGQMVENYSKLISNPAESFAERPVGTALDLAAPASILRNGTRAMGRGLYNAGARRAGVTGKTLAEEAAALQGGFENGIGMSEAGANRGKAILEESTGTTQRLEQTATQAGGTSDFLQHLGGGKINPELLQHVLNYLRRPNRLEHAVNEQVGNLTDLATGQRISTSQSGDITRHWQELADSAFEASTGLGNKGPATRAKASMFQDMATGAKNATEASVRDALGNEALDAYKAAKAKTREVYPATKAADTPIGVGALPGARAFLSPQGIKTHGTLGLLSPSPKFLSGAGLTLKALADMPGVKQALGQPGTTRLLLAFQLAQEAGDDEAAQAIVGKLMNLGGE